MMRCAECRTDPALIVAYEPLGLVADLQGLLAAASRDGAPLADVTAVRGPPCAYAPGVAGNTAPLGWTG